MDKGAAMKPRNAYGYPVPYPSARDRMPPRMLAALQSITKDRLAGKEPTLAHYAAVFNEIGAAVSWQDAELAQTVLWLGGRLNDVLLEAFTAPFGTDKPGRSNMSTDELNLRSDILKAIRLAPKKQAAIREIAALVRRKLAHVRVATLTEWHRDQQRKVQRGRPNPALQRRLDLEVPGGASTSDAEKYRLLLTRIRRATEPPKKD
jgi:hypothetical protein